MYVLYFVSFEYSQRIFLFVTAGQISPIIKINKMDFDALTVETQI